MGYNRAGFEIVGVDISPQPNYPFEFHQADAIGFFYDEKNNYDVYHASPPCQAFTKARFLQGNYHEDFIGAIRDCFLRNNKPWIIENVPGAPLKNPTLLCGFMFGENYYRHRLFETSFSLPVLNHPKHTKRQNKMGRPAKENEVLQVVGHFSGVPRARKEMGCEWMTQGELAQAIPPVYTEWIGKELIKTATQDEEGKI